MHKSSHLIDFDRGGKNKDKEAAKCAQEEVGNKLSPVDNDLFNVLFGLVCLFAFTPLSTQTAAKTVVSDQNIVRFH